MARTSPLHWVGVIFLLIASILLLITTISAPVLKDIAILKVMLTNKTEIRNSSVIFGMFGHCILDVPPVQTDQDFCYPKSIGYAPAAIMSTINHGTNLSPSATHTVDALTKAMILHPIACALAFIAFVLSCGAGIVGSLLGAAVGALAWVLALVVMAIDFSIFGPIKSHVNASNTGLHAYYSVGMWTTLAAMILLFFGMFIVLFTCFSARKAKRNAGYVGNGGGRRNRDEKHVSGAYVDDGGTGNGGYGGDRTVNRGYNGNGGYPDIRGAGGRKKRFGIF